MKRGFLNKKDYAHAENASNWIQSQVARTTTGVLNGCAFVPQADFVWGADGRRTCDHVLCYDELRESFDVLMAHLSNNTRVGNVPRFETAPQLSHHMPSTLTPDDLTPRAREAVLSRYAEDACFLGYGPCASEALRLARARLERPVKCGRGHGLAR